MANTALMSCVHRFHACHKFHQFNSENLQAMNQLLELTKKKGRIFTSRDPYGYSVASEMNDSAFSLNHFSWDGNLVGELFSEFVQTRVITEN